MSAQARPMANWPTPARNPAAALARIGRSLTAQARSATPMKAQGHSPKGGSESATRTPSISGANHTRTRLVCLTGSGGREPPEQLARRSSSMLGCRSRPAKDPPALVQVARRQLPAPARFCGGGQAGTAGKPAASAAPGWKVAGQTHRSVPAGPFALPGRDPRRTSMTVARRRNGRSRRGRRLRRAGPYGATSRRRTCSR